MIKRWLAPICALGFCAPLAQLHAQPSAEDVATSLAAIESAKAVAEAGRGSLLMVGSILSPDENSHDEMVVVLDYPVVGGITGGMILILAKLACQPIDQCLIARRVTEIDPQNGVQTEPYGAAEGLLLTKIKATLIGSVAYAVDLHTGAIRDMHVDRARDTLTQSEAVALEQARTHHGSAAGLYAGGA
jgi:hypothetical protein